MMMPVLRLMSVILYGVVFMTICFIVPPHPKEWLLSSWFAGPKDRKGSSLDPGLPLALDARDGQHEGGDRGQCAKTYIDCNGVGEDCVGQAAEGSRRLAIGSDRATDVAAVPGIEFALQPGVLDHRPGFHQAHQPLFPQVVLAQVPCLLLGQTKFLQTGFHQPCGLHFIVSAQRGRAVGFPFAILHNFGRQSFQFLSELLASQEPTPEQLLKLALGAFLFIPTLLGSPLQIGLIRAPVFLVVAAPNDANSGPCRSETTRPSPRQIAGKLRLSISDSLR